MERDLKNKKGMSKVMLVGIITFTLLFGIMLISALILEEQNAFVNEVNSLENELGNNGYGWLVNYSANKNGGTIYNG